MAHNDIELVDREYGHIRIPLSRKIKFKRISFINISANWNKFRLNRLKSKLITNKEKLVAMEFKQTQLDSISGREKVAEKVLKKTTAIARLESKIKLLETGNYSTERFINSRAIKLKDLMMSNLEYRRDILYGVNDTAAEEIKNGLPEEITPASKETTPTITEDTKNAVFEQEMHEQKQKIDQTVQAIMAEEKARTENQTEKIIQMPQTKVENENILENVTTSGDDNRSKKSEEVAESKIDIPNEPIDKEDIVSAINEAMSEINVAKPVTQDDIISAVNEEMEKIKVSNNGSSAAKVNKFINDDGTYRMRREDIDEDFRITRIDRTKMPITEAPVEQNIEPDIPPFAKNVRKVPDMDTPRKAITQIPETKKYIIEPIQFPNIKGIYAEESIKLEQAEEREIPLVVPTREKESVEKKDTPDGIVFNNDIQAYLNKASILRRELATIQADYVTEENAAQSKQREYERTLGQFASYVDSLEEQCNTRYQETKQLQESNEALQAQIDAMVVMMSTVTPVIPEREGKRARTL